MALGQLRISLNEWPQWSLREFHNAYEAWTQVNVRDPWMRARAISFYVVKASLGGSSVKEWKDMFTIPGEKVRKRQKAVARELTKEEQEIMKLIPKHG